MNYRVVYTDSFLADVRDHLDFLRGRHVGEHVIENWYTKLFDRLEGLDEWPLTFAVSDAYSRRVGRNTHKYNFGDYLVFYQVNDEHQRVELVAFFNGAKNWKT
jgi:mRNA-degrading endonuclease RelE of RelBE toxin-antitoxin system